MEVDLAAQRQRSLLDRRTIELHQQLQSLLDAQADRHTHAARHDTNITEFATPSTSAILYNSARKVVPVRQPSRDRFSLNAARRGITAAMRELSEIKVEDICLIDSMVTRITTVSEQIDTWQEKQRQLHEQVQGIKSDESSARLSELQQEHYVLQDEIESLELRLAEQRSKQRAVVREMTDLENSLNAKLSSYRESLTSVDREVNEFLRNLARFPGSSQDIYPSAASGRRTLQLAKEQTLKHLDILGQQRSEAENEHHALDEGTKLWQQVLDELHDVEKYVAVSLKTMAYSTSIHIANVQNNENSTEVEPCRIIARVDQAITFLEAELGRAQDLGWTLLLCCISAELEGLVHARKFLIQESELMTSKGSPYYIIMNTILDSNNNRNII